MIRRGAALLVLTLLGGVLPLRAERGPGPDPHPAPEPVLVELELARLATRTVSAFRAGETPLVPFTAFLEMAELAVLRRPGGVLETMVQPGNLPLSIDPTTRVLKLGNEKRTLADTQMVALDGEIYVATTVLAQAFNLEWGVSWSDLEVVILDPSSLPLARRLRRESFLKSRLAQSQETQLTGVRLGLERQGVKGLVFDYSVLTPTTSMVKGGAYSTTLGLDVLGGSFSAGLQSQNGADRAPRADVSWTGIWRESPYLAQVQLGDGISSGPRSRTLRGVSLSNAPFARPSIIGNVPFGGQLGPGWTVEAYRGGRLIGFDSVNALGQFSFDVPVQYGENPVDFVAYGPFGELREFNRTYRVRTEGLPARRLEYGLSAGECRTDRCSATGNLDLRYGITNRWTARAGVDQFWRDSLGNLSHPYLGVTGNLGNAFLVEGEAVGDAVLRGVGRFEPSLNLQLQVEANRYARGVRDPILTPEGRLSQYTLSAFFRPVSRLGATYLEGSLDRIHGSLYDLTSARLGASLQLSDLRLLPSVRFETSSGQGSSATRTFYGVNTFMLPRPSLGSMLGKLSARTTFEMEAGAGASSASGYIGMPILRGLRTETGLSWFRGMKGPTFTLLIAAELPSVRSYTTVSGGGGNPALGTQYVQGSAVYDASSGAVNFEAGPSVQRGGVSGRVFLDANGNGRYDRGDTPLAGVRVVVGPVYATSDSSGNYSVWDLLPYEPTPVTVDSASIPSPLWVPAFNAALVEPSPNRYRSVDVPVLPGGAVEGMVHWRDGTAADTLGATRSVAGVVLVFRHKASGEQRVVTTFTDGGFYVMGLRPGDWEVTVDQRCLGLLHASAELAKFSIRALADGDAVNGLNLTLRSE